MTLIQDLGYEPDDLDVTISELLVATSDESDKAIDGSVPEVLRLLRDKMRMDVVFVSEFADGQRVIKHVDSRPGKGVVSAGDADPLEESWCQRVVDGRLPQFIDDAGKLPAASALLEKQPFPIGTHISTPIVLKDGEIYGTLCAFSFAPNEAANHGDLKRLQFTAQLAAQKIDKQRLADQDRPPQAELSLAPVEPPRRRK